MSGSEELSRISGEMLEAIELELATIRKELGPLGDLYSVKVTDGRQLIAEPGAYLYRFHCDLEQRIPGDTQVQLVTPADSVAGEVVDHDPDLDSIEFTLRNSLGETVPEAKLQFDTSHLLTMLAQRIQTIADQPADFYPDRALRLLTGTGAGRPFEPPQLEGLNASQLRAIGFVLANDVSYVWGPPGTGKTRTVAHMIHEMVDRHDRVVITAHTNVATDNALLQVLRIMLLPENSVVRVGYHAEALRDYKVGLDDVVERVLQAEHGDLLAGIEGLSSKLAAALHGPSSRLTSSRTPPSKRLRIAIELLKNHDLDDKAALLTLAGNLAQALGDVEGQVINRAVVVATTLTRIYTSPHLRDLRTDNVVIDEASVASLPQTFSAACIAGKRVVAVGDFMQLPTIVKTSHPQGKFWLGRHVFASAAANVPEKDHPLRAMLVDQYRMHPQISSLVSRTFYAGKLLDAEDVVRRSDAGPAILLVDSTGPACRSEHTRTGSKQNTHHGSIIARLVAMAGTKDIAVITPYRAQVRLIRDELRKTAPDLLATGDLEVFTVHRFQGRDKDLVIFDMVEAPGTLCVFLDELKNRDAPNLINVAISRAKKRLVIVGNIPHLKSSLGQKCLIARIFEHVRTRGGQEVEWAFEGDHTAIDRFMRGAG